MTCSLERIVRHRAANPFHPVCCLGSDAKKVFGASCRLKRCGHDVLQRLPVAGSILRFFEILVLEVMPMVPACAKAR